MSSRAWALLRDARYALPGRIGAMMPQPDPARLARAMARRGLNVTFGYFAGDDSPAHTIVAAHARLAEALTASATPAYLSLKAPQLGFDPQAIRQIADLGLELVFDAHAPAQADRTLALAERFAAGCVIPARWRRSLGDAVRLRDAAVRVRLVKGEWADPEADAADPAQAYLDLVRELAGRSAPVAVASHDPALVRQVLTVLREAGTRCELEQLHGLPRRRTAAIARELGVPVRIYLPHGPGWWPYAIDKALGRPYLPQWWLADIFGLSPSA